MAASTIVFTYVVGAGSGTGEKEASVTSFTVDGSAYAALSDAEVIEAAVLFKQGLAALVRDAKLPHLGFGGRDLTA